MYKSDQRIESNAILFLLSFEQKWNVHNYANIIRWTISDRTDIIAISMSLSSTYMDWQNWSKELKKYKKLDRQGIHMPSCSSRPSYTCPEACRSNPVMIEQQNKPRTYTRDRGPVCFNLWPILKARF